MSNEPVAPQFDYVSLQGAFMRLDEALEKLSTAQVTLCVFGATSLMLRGAIDRKTQDIDVWRLASQINDRLLALAASAADLDLNPTTLTPERTYLQIVSPGVVQFPKYDVVNQRWSDGSANETLWQGSRLTVVAPPPAIVAALKLVRAEPKDIEDVTTIISLKLAARHEIEAAIELLPDDARNRAAENVVFLDLIPDDGDEARPPSSNFDYGR